jgi:hypothetical protein
MRVTVSSAKGENTQQLAAYPYAQIVLQENTWGPWVMTMRQTVSSVALASIPRHWAQQAQSHALTVERGRFWPPQAMTTKVTVSSVHRARLLRLMGYPCVDIVLQANIQNS